MARSEKLLKTTALVTIVIIISKVCGFARDMITANYFGTGMESAAYTAAYSLFYLPVLLFSSCITSTLIPMYYSARSKRGLDTANRFASNSLNIFCLCALIISAIMYVFAEPLVKVIYMGFGAEQSALTVKLTRIMLISLMFNVMSITLSTLLNAREKFLAAQLTGFPLSVCVIGAAVIFSGKYGVTALAWGVFAAGVLQVIVQLPFTRGWFRYSPRVNFKSKRFKRLMRMAIPATLAMAVSELNHMIDHMLASSLGEAAIPALTYAYRLITFISGILIVPITTIMFSRMSRLAAKSDARGIVPVVKRCFEIIALIVAPIIVVSAVLNVDIIRFAYARGAFGAESVRVTSGAFLFYVIGVLGFGLRDLLNRAFHSIQDARTPFRVSCFVVALNIALNLILRELMGVNGLALATTIAGTSGMLTMLIMLRRRVGRLGFRDTLFDLFKILCAAILSTAACMALNAALPRAANTLGLFARLAAITIMTFGVYALSCLILGERRITAFASGVIKKK